MLTWCAASLNVTVPTSISTVTINGSPDQCTHPVQNYTDADIALKWLLCVCMVQQNVMTTMSVKRANSLSYSVVLTATRSSADCASKESNTHAAAEPPAVVRCQFHYSVQSVLMFCRVPSSASRAAEQLSS